jgi:hypothetical protein
MDKTIIRTYVRGAYDVQKLRIQTGNRIVANFKTQLGQAPGTKEDELTDEAKLILNNFRNEYDLITDAIVEGGILRITDKVFKGRVLISNSAIFTLVRTYVNLSTDEDDQFKEIGKIVKKEPIWGAFLEGVRGCGPTMAAIIISEIDISKAAYPSSLWMLTGLDVAPDGRGRSMRAEHLVDRAYLDKEGVEQTKKSITFNPLLKTKMMGVLASSFIKSGGHYADIYYNYKNRLGNRPDLSEESKGHIHNMSLRYMIKMFYIDLYNAWRPLAGLPVAPPYHVAKLGLRDHSVNA